jgi:maltooligosyltrehalose trehalohydrolase
VLAKTLTRAFLHDGGWSAFRGREWGRPVDPARHDGRRFLGYLQTHDQVGNRATGEPISALVDPAQQATGATLYLTSAFTPMVFMGEEWAASTPWQYFTDFSDTALGEAVSNGRRSEFAEHGWDAEDVPDPQDHATRDRSVLRWSEREHDGHARMLAWYRDLAALRRREPVLTDGRLAGVDVRFDEDARWLVVARGDLRVACNLADEPQTVPLDAPAGKVVLAWDEPSTSVGDAGVDLAAHAVAVVSVQP